MAVWWTKTSGAPSGWEMNPKPFSELNHLTVPCATSGIPLVRADVAEGLPSRAVLPYRCELPSAAKLAAAASDVRTHVVLGNAGTWARRQGTSPSCSER